MCDGKAVTMSLDCGGEMYFLKRAKSREHQPFDTSKFIVATKFSVEAKSNYKGFALVTQ